MELSTLKIGLMKRIRANNVFKQKYMDLTVCKFKIQKILKTFEAGL